MKFLSSLLAGFAFLASAAAQTLPEPAPPPLEPAEPALPSPDYDRLDARLTVLASQQDMAGLAVAVIERGEIAFAKGYGETRHGSGLPVTEDTVFRWASLSKGVAATTVAMLDAEGALSLDDTVGRYGTSLRLPGGGEASATIENVLSHMVGIVPNAYDLRLEDGNDPKEIRKALGKLRATCPVGDCHTYQNVAFDTVSEIVEAVSGGFTFTELTAAQLFAPLEMRRASFGRAALQASDSWAEPHRKRKGRDMEIRIVNDSYYNVPAAGGVNGSILDLARFARSQMGLAPDVLPQYLLDELHAPRVYTRGEQSGISRRYGGHLKDARYALGWRTYKYADTGARVVGHRGAVDGYRSLILFDGETDSGVVALWNSNARDPVRIQFEVMDMLYGLPDSGWLVPQTEGMGN